MSRRLTLRTFNPQYESDRFRAPGMLTTWWQIRGLETDSPVKVQLIMNANQSLAIPAMARKASTGCHTWPSRCFDSISSKSCKSFDEKCEDRAHGSPAQKDEEHAADD